MEKADIAQMARDTCAVAAEADILREEFAKNGLATIWNYFFVIIKRVPTDFDGSVSTLFLFVITICDKPPLPGSVSRPDP